MCQLTCMFCVSQGRVRRSYDKEIKNLRGSSNMSWGFPLVGRDGRASVM